MDSRNPLQKPFYLFDLRRYKSEPAPLAAQLNGICKDLRGELKKLPQKKKQSSLEYFLGGKYGIDEEIRHLQLAPKTLIGSNDDHCSLANIVGKIKTCCFSKQLMPFTTSQLKGFQLQELPPETQLFPPCVTGGEDLFDNNKEKKEAEKTKKDESAKGNAKPFPTNGQRFRAPLPAVQLAESTAVISGVPVKSSLASSHPSSIAKKSVAAALKGVRSRFSKSKGRGRGRPVVRKTKRGLQNIPSKLDIPSTRRGRGRPRKNVIVDQGFFIKESPTPPPPPSPAATSSSSSYSSSPLTPPPLVVPSDATAYSIKELCNLKMKLKVHQPKKFTSIPKIAPPSSKNTFPSIFNQPREERPKLILKIQLHRSGGGQEEMDQSKHSSSEDEDDKCLDLY